MIRDEFFIDFADQMRTEYRTAMIDAGVENLTLLRVEEQVVDRMLAWIDSKDPQVDRAE